MLTSIWYPFEPTALKCFVAPIPIALVSSRQPSEGRALLHQMLRSGSRLSLPKQSRIRFGQLYWLPCGPTFLLRTSVSCHWELFLRWPHVDELRVY
jgi:hypothetical protein